MTSASASRSIQAALLAAALLLTTTACSEAAGGLADVPLDAFDVPFELPELPGIDVASDASDPDTATTPDAPADTTGTDPDLHGWIGSPCASSAECGFAGGVCLGAEHGYAGGMCSQGCDRICPDRDGHPVTFCATAAAPGPLAGQGHCLSRCDRSLYPDTGCRDGYACRIVGRHNEPATTVAACLREDDPSGMPLPDCLAELDALGIAWEPWAYATQSPDGRPDLTCDVADPIYVHSPINGVDYRYYSHDEPARMAVACDLALALHRLGDVLASHDIDQALHIGTFNCRAIADSDSLSQHGLARAIDLWGFVDRSGRRYVLEQHWEHETETPSTHEGQVLLDLARQMHEQRIFNIVLTPNYNAAHDNHFHVDLTTGSHFMGVTGGLPHETWYLGPNDGRAGCF